jgi:hypothetical protein
MKLMTKISEGMRRWNWEYSIIRYLYYVRSGVVFEKDEFRIVKNVYYILVQSQKS